MLVDLAVSIDGRAIADGVEVVSVDVFHGIDRIPRATVVFRDGNEALENFPLASSGTLRPGSEMAIVLTGGESFAGPTTDATIFRGPILKIAVNADTAEGLTTRAEAADEAHVLVQTRRTVGFVDKSDVDVIRKILGDAGLSVGDMPSGAPKQRQLVQHDASDWDFIVTRADAIGHVVVVEDGRLSLKRPAPTGAPLRIELGSDEVYATEFELDGSYQPTAVGAVSWSADEQKLRRKSRASAPSLGQGEIDPERVASRLRHTEELLAHPTALASSEQQSWADAVMARRRLSMIRGSVSISGRADVALLQRVELVGVSKPFEGSALVCAVRHRVNAGGWRTDLQFGLDPERFVERVRTEAPRASGLLPSARDLRIGIVADVEDPQGAHRIKVSLPDAGAQPVELWARLATGEAGPERGTLFLPDIGDEVVVGFLGADPRAPVVLGSLFSATNAAPTELTPEIRGFVGGSGAALLRRDADKPTLTLQTPKAQIVLDDEGDTVVVKDGAGNEVALSSSGIKVISAKDLNLEASGKITIKGAQVEIE